MKRADITVQTCAMSEFPALRGVVEESESLDHHTDYTYWVALNQWPHLFLTAKHDGRIVGFAFGLRNAAHPERLFLWQIGVLTSHRRKGIASKLVNELCKRAAKDGIEELWFTIADEIAPSLALFRKIASAFGSSMVERGSTGDLGGPLHPERIYSIAIPRS